MKKIMLLVLAVLAFVAMSSTVSAQNYNYPGYVYSNGLTYEQAVAIAQARRAAVLGATGGYPTNYPGQYPGSYNQYGYYDPAYLRQMISLPESLLACRVVFGTQKVTDCEPVIKDVATIQQNAANHQYEGKVFVTYHVYKGKDHFHPVDDTNHRLGKAGAIAIGTGAGAGGGALLAGRKGAVGGGIIGAFVGWWASRNSNSHDACKIMDDVPSTVPQNNEAPASYKEQVPTTRPVAGPAATGSGEGEFTIENTTGFRVDVFYDGKLIGRMGRPGIDPGASPMHVDYPEICKVYSANMIVPNEEGGVSLRPAKIVPGNSGLTFADPTSAQGR